MKTKQLADFLAGLRFEELDAKTVDCAKMCVQDLLGVAIAGAKTDTGKIWETYSFSGARQPEEATRWAEGFAQSGYRETAAYNAACGHLLDLDDVHNASITHMGAVTIPAAMAIGQKHRASGADVITAIVAGYEIGARVGEAINPGAYWYWHTTGVVGSFSSAAASGKILGLDGKTLLNAFGSAGTQSAGLWEFLEDGCMSKSLHTANATLCGIRAAELAALGFTGASRILEGKKGLVGALTDHGDVEALTRGLEQRQYKIRSNSFKPYACCRHIHSANFCVEKMAQKHPLVPAEIAHITDRTYQVAKDVADHAKPTTAYAYKFSIQYCVAAMLLYGSLMEESFTEERTTNPEVRELMGKIDVVVDEQLQREYLQDKNQWSHILEITMKDGTVISQRIDYPLGDFQNPFDWETANRKFRTVTDGILPSGTADRLMEGIQTMDRLSDINRLFTL